MSQRTLFDNIDSPWASGMPGYPAAWSPCRQYRYTLWRTWTNNPRPRYAMFCCLNPSTATEFEDDPTVRRCVGYAKAWGFDAFVMANLFAFMATDPRNMKAASDPIGPENDEWLAKLAAGAGLVVAGWGVHGEFMGRAAQVRRLLGELHYLKLTKGGQPMHPLYLRADLQPQRWG